MSFIPLKRRRAGPVSEEPLDSLQSLFPDVCLFLVERRMGSARRKFLTGLAQKKGFCVTPQFSDQVTHVVSEQNSCSEVLLWIERQSGQKVQPGGAEMTPHILDITWFTESMSLGKPVKVEPRHCLGVSDSSVSRDKATQEIPAYGCQRRTPLHHHNKEITDALEILALSASFQGSEARFLGFTRASSVLKSLPFRLQSVEEVKDLPWCGGHSQTVIQEILEDGVCREVETVKNSEHFQSMKALTSIFGVGIRTADKWYRDGVRSLSDLNNLGGKLTAEQKAGLLHYTDLQQSVTREEAGTVEQLIKGALQSFVPDVRVTMTGGFRRGKQEGHDVDFLITHPDEEALNGLLRKAVAWLDGKGSVLYYHVRARSQNFSGSNTMDGHETCYSIIALPNVCPEKPSPDAEKIEPDLDKNSLRNWKAVRVDLVVCPYSEYFYALLGWTGSKHFERELRRFSLHVKKMSLNSHGLFDIQKNATTLLHRRRRYLHILDSHMCRPPRETPDHRTIEASGIDPFGHTAAHKPLHMGKATPPANNADSMYMLKSIKPQQ
ncbi:DNA-directed DNA/RNA polymerase mu isoform X2 [Xenopus tropicalis]|nr:DNA-directed DNA/RNA polymerase mu isoform X2 [Xenopus tropicalis]XP_031753768.1 DNA-directed DNA/RNA polymerase mu isoform X2 [Xenopus tropicalis]